MSQRATAPERILIEVKVAASMLACLSAARQSRELLANAIIASRVKMKTCVILTNRKRSPHRSSPLYYCPIRPSPAPKGIINSVIDRACIRGLQTRNGGLQTAVLPRRGDLKSPVFFGRRFVNRRSLKAAGPLAIKPESLSPSALD